MFSLCMAQPTRQALKPIFIEDFAPPSQALASLPVIPPQVSSFLLIGSATYLAYKMLAMYQLSNEVSTTVDKVSFKLDTKDLGLQISVACSVDNPTNESVNISRPVVTLKIAGTGFATQPNSERYTIRPLSRSSVGTYSFFISWSDLGNYLLRAAPKLAFEIPSIVSAFKALKGKSKGEQFSGITSILKDKIKVPVSILTTFYVGVFGFNFIKVPTFETPLIEY